MTRSEQLGHAVRRAAADHGARFVITFAELHCHYSAPVPMHIGAVIGAVGRTMNLWGFHLCNMGRGRLLVRWGRP